MLMIFLMASVLIGPGLSFHKVYLFHVFLIPEVIRNLSLKNIKDFCIEQPILIGLLIYSGVSILWSNSLAVGVKDFIYLLLGVSFIYALLTSKVESEKLIKVILAVMALDFVVSVGESLTLFRYPFSRYSPHATFFGLNYTGPLPSVPTGFHHNPNNNAFFILIFTPIILSILKSWKRGVYLAISTFLIFMASSKLVLISWIFLLVILCLFFLWQKNGIKRTLFFSVASLGILLSLFSVSQGQRMQKYKRAVPTLITFGTEAPAFLYKRFKGEDVKFDYSSIDLSLHERLVYLDGVAKIISENWLLGAGGGSLESIFNTQGPSTMSMKHPHFYFLELFAKYGIFFLGFYLFWIGKLFLSVSKVNALFGLSLLLFVFLNPVIASAVYFLPKWGLYGVLLKIVKEKEEEPNAF